MHSIIPQGKGAARKNTKEFIQFLYHSLGSASEIEIQLEIAKELEYIDNSEDLNKSLHQIILMLTGLIGSLKKKVTRK